MTQNNTSDKQPILKDAASLWRSLSASAELNKICYDKELLSGNDSTPGLYGHLGIGYFSGDFTADLQTESVSVEKLLIAFFKTLQPYARMMSDLCSFFQRHAIQETNEHIRIQFDFSAQGLEKLDFDLDHFREHLAQYDRVQELVNYLFLDHNSIWLLLNILSKDYSQQSEARWITEWSDNFKNGIWNPVETPVSGFANLDNQLGRLFGIWNSFGQAAAGLGITPKTASGFFSQKQSQDQDEEELKIGWDTRTLAGGTSDLWPATFLHRLFYRLEYLEGGIAPESREQEADLFAEEIEMFLEDHGITGQRESSLLKELQELLKLPVWRKRHELYSVWILALMDKVMAKYPGYMIHDHDGLLLFAFRPTKLASFDTITGKAELWTELRMPLENPEGHGRTGNIQPDYIYLKQGEQPVAENGLVVVEVKQYQIPGTRNFTGALNDYSRGVENAHVFLVNYGAVRSTMFLERPERCTALGQIRPGNLQAGEFQDALAKVLPEIPPVLDPDILIPWGQADWMLLYLGYEYIYVDISASLNHDRYKKFLNTVLKWSIGGGSVGRLVAIDEQVRQIWTSPVKADVDALLELPFNAGTDFKKLIQGERILIITDEDGLNIVRYINYSPNCHVICYRENDSVDYFVDLNPIV